MKSKNKKTWKPVLISLIALSAIAMSAGAANAHTSTTVTNASKSAVSVQPTTDKETSVSGLNLVGKTLTTDSYAPLKAQGKVVGGTSRFVELQKYDAKTKQWSIVRSNYTLSNNTFAFALDQTKATTTYRIYVHADYGYKAFTGKATSVKRVAKKSSATHIRADRTSIAPWATNKGHVYVSSFLFAGEKKPTVTLQELTSSKKWKTLKTVNNWGNVTFTLPKGTTNSKNATKTYRYVIGGTKMANGTTSKAFSVKWENPRKYTGTKLKAYNYSKKYCPTMLITIKNLPKGIAGLAYSGQDRTELSPKIAAKDLRTVTLHECAHHMQYKLYYNSNADWNKFEKRMNSLYKVKSKGIEHNADCIANVWHKNTYWGYKKKCSGNTLAAARKIASGKKW